MNYRRIVALGLAGALTLSSVPAFAAETVDAKGKALYQLGLFQGYSKDKMELGLADNLTREQAVKLTLSYLGYEQDDLDKDAKTSFKDVKEGGWAAPWIKKAKELGITSGVSETEFGYGESVTKHQLTTFMLRALGYDNAWNKAADLGLSLSLLKANDLVNFDEKSIRGDFANIGYNTLTADVVGSDQTLAEKLADKEVIDEKVAEELGLIEKKIVKYEIESIESLNLAETKVTFTKDLAKDEIAKDKFSNFKVNKRTVKGIKKVDDNTIILFHDAIENGKTVKVEIKDVKNIENDKLAKTSQDVKYLDTELPTLKGAEVIGSKTIRLTFSEAMKSDSKGEFDKNAFKITKENGAKVYISKAVVAGDNNRQVDLKLLTSLDQQEYTIRVNPSITDYAKFGLVDSVTVDVTKDKEAPEVVGFKSASETGVTLIFNEDIVPNSISSNSFYHTNTSNPIDVSGYEIDGKELTLKFKKNPLPQGTAYIFIKENTLKDLWGNKIDDLRTSITIEEDNEAPIIETVEQGSANNQIVIKFKENDVKETEAEKRSNYKVLNSKGKEVSVRNAVLDSTGKKVTLTLKEDVAGDIVLTVKNLKDNKNNKMGEEEFSITLNDKIAPVFPDDVTKFDVDDNLILRIKFKEAGRMAEEGSYSVLDKDRYQLLFSTKRVDLTDLDDAEVRVLEDGVTVEIVLSKSEIKNEKLGTLKSLSVARVADLAGNLTAEQARVYQIDKIVDGSNLVVKKDKVEATGVNTIKVTLNGRLSDVEFEDFEIRMTDKETKKVIKAEVGSTDVTIDKDGNTVLTFIMEKEFGVSPKGYDFAVIGQKSVTEYGLKVELTDTNNRLAVIDKIAPVLDKDNTKDENSKKGVNGQLTLLFKEELKNSNVSLASTDLRITSNDSGKDLVAGRDYTITISGNKVLVKLDNKTEFFNDKDFTVEIRDAKYLADTAGNVADDFNVDLTISNTNNR